MSVLASKVKTIWSDVYNCENAHNADGVEPDQESSFVQQKSSVNQN